jgi:hypothetical protein
LMYHRHDLLSGSDLPPSSERTDILILSMVYAKPES